MRAIFVAVILFAAPAFASLASRSASDDETRSAPMQGFYAGIGGGGVLVILDSGNGFGYDVEARIGYSFNPGLQLYLSGSLDSATVTGATYRSELIGVVVQYHLFARPGLGVYGRAGVGLALSSYINDAVGLSGLGGIGVEIGLSPGLFLTPELFYKNENLSYSNGGGTYGVSVIGLQLALIYY